MIQKFKLTGDSYLAKISIVYFPKCVPNVTELNLSRFYLIGIRMNSVKWPDLSHAVNSEKN